MENKQIAETKTPEHEILEKYVCLYFSSHHDKSKWNGEGENGGAEWHAHKPIAEDIFKAMREFADQEKRATAIGFAEWLAESRWRIRPDTPEGEQQLWYWPSDDHDVPDEDATTDQLYSHYLNYIANASQPPKK